MSSLTYKATGPADQRRGLIGLDDAVNCGTGFCSFGRSTEQPVLPAYGEVPDGPFTDIVRYGSLSIFQVSTQLFSVESGSSIPEPADV